MRAATRCVPRSGPAPASFHACRPGSRLIAKAGLLLNAFTWSPLLQDAVDRRLRVRETLNVRHIDDKNCNPCLRNWCVRRAGVSGACECRTERYQFFIAQNDSVAITSRADDGSCALDWSSQRETESYPDNRYTGSTVTRAPTGGRLTKTSSQQL